MRRMLVICVLLLLSIAPVSALTLKQNLGTSTTILDNTQLVSLGPNAYSAAGPVYDNAVGQAGDGALRCRLELSIIFAAAPTANTAVVVWLVRSYDGTNYEPTPTSAIGPGSAFAIAFPVNSGQVTTRGVADIDCPPGRFKAVLKNDNTGQAFTSGTQTLKVAPIVFTGN